MDINNEMAFCVMNKQLNSSAKPSKPEIKRAFLHASSHVRYQIYGTVEHERKYMVHKLLDFHKTNQLDIRRKIAHLTILFETLANIEDENKESEYIYEIFASLAYTYKDSEEASWEDSLRFMNIAIDKRNTECNSGKIDRRFYVDYEINRILYNINIGNLNDIQKDFDWVWSFDDGRYRIMNVPPVIFPQFYDWMDNHKRKEMLDWLRQHPDKQRDWLNMFESEEFKEKVRKSL